MSKKIISVILALVMLFSVLTLFSACDSGHAPGYGKTNKCTICGKKATHKTSKYGFCDKHWKKATNQQIDVIDITIEE